MLAFNLSSSSAFAIDPEITEMLVEMQGMPPEEMMADPGALLEMMAALYGGIQILCDAHMDIHDEEGSEHRKGDQFRT